MAIERVLTPHVPEPAPGLWSNCLRHGNNVYIAGLVAVDADFNVLAVGDPGEQSRIVFRSIRHYLEAAGGSLADMVRMRVYLSKSGARPTGVSRRPPGVLHGQLPVFDAGGGLGAGEAGDAGGGRCRCDHRRRCGIASARLA